MRLRDITPRDLVTALRAAWSLCVFWVLVRTRDVPALESRLRVRSGETGPAPGWMTPARLVGIVRHVARVHPLRPRCLEQALTAAVLAERAGLSTSVRIGVRRVPRFQRSEVPGFQGSCPQRTSEPKNLGTPEPRNPGTPAFDAHAWVVISGITVDPSAPSFTPLLSLHGGLRDRSLAISS